MCLPAGLIHLLLIRLLRLSSCGLVLVACSACKSGPVAVTNLPASTIPAALPPTSTAPPPIPASPIPTDTPLLSPSPVATVSSLKATVTAERLSCRYGPGPEYLYLYGLRKGANIVLIGRADSDNWHWVYVQGRSRCWVNTGFLEIDGEWQSLPIVYPGTAKLPVSPYYPPTSIRSVVRKGDQVTVEWLDIPLRAGDEEDASMLRYVVEVWHCESGSLLFEPLATNELSITLTDQPGCMSASHGRILVQEKHGFSGPTEIPWPRR